MRTSKGSNANEMKNSPAFLGESLDRRSLAYVAAAAGVTVLATVQPATAKVVYTPTNEAILFRGEHLDLNHDGVPDFGFHGAGVGNYYGDFVAPLKFNKLYNFASPMAAGVSVGPGGKFAGQKVLMIGDFANSVSTAYIGQWLGQQNQYMGLQFSIHGAAHFGWARFSVSADRVVTLTGYAYETIPLKPIVTGDTGSDEESANQPGSTTASPQLQRSGLGRLALGAAGRNGRPGNE